jgi:peptidoglycan/LPS O-acetylase OafA/YrhL
MKDSAFQPPGRLAYLQNLQILRCVAAVMVLFSHLEQETASGRVGGVGPVHDVTGISWASGVDVFFVVSGFIMYRLTADRFGRGAYALEFLKRRFIRIVPLYWIFTSLMLAAIEFAPGRVRHADAGLSRVLFSYLFLPTSRADGLVMPVLAIGWTLNLEVLFYLAYGAALTAPKRIGLGLLAAGFLLMAAFGGRAAAILPPLGFWSQPIILEFPLGLFLAHLWGDRGLRIGRGAQAALVVVAFALMAVLDRLATPVLGPLPAGFQPPDWSRWMWGGLPAFLLCAALMLGPAIGGVPGKALAQGGDASYALYLSHPFVLNLVALLWVRLAAPASGWAYLAAGMTACIAAALAVHALVERPILSVLRRRFEPARAAVPA